MNWRKLFMLAGLAAMLIFSLAACGDSEKASGEEKKSGEEEKKNDENKDEGSQEAEEDDDFGIATSIEEILKEKPGKYPGTKYNEAIVHKALNEENFLEKDSFQIYAELLRLMGEGKNYKEYYDYFEAFVPDMETEISQMPGGMNISEDGELGMNANVSILLDASGSMAQKVGGKTKMELAKEAINEFLSSMPEGANVSLRVYGHKGSNADSDKKVSCDSTEVVYDLKAYDKAAFASSLDSFKPTGWTPIAKAITEAKGDFEKAGNDGQNIIYIVSDGVETCDGDPAKAAKELHDSNIAAVVNVIGFNVDSAGQNQLMSVAQAGGGKYETVNSGADFNELWEKERRRLWNEWWDWSNKNWNLVWEEQSKKSNALLDQDNEFRNKAFDEESRLKEAAYYLQEKEQLTYETRQEVYSLIEQRHDIIKEYRKNRYEELKETLKTNGENLKTKIKEKGEEMKKKYSNN
ncbi:VWA domain-containing protein [Bacillus sp. ISL-35]|uniref:VWA domain-containing protein n=1 Tax=Bacillus sp. ISL-35 TaxID=2819122 RepID=UPI001BECE4A7|nr:VWA domain-containing protein [Bacillus sp. ISL-35]MBT2680710.1 VWA domain-containing protein [Bacillus sp. ISL-35]MBT2702658.1 VWA domain-containing protein [Chryseobacterium sp. ISL-80]